MKVKKQQLKLDMEQQTGSKEEKVYVKAVYCHPAYITYMQSPSSKMVVWGGLTNSFEKKGSKKQRRKGKRYPFECRVPKNSKER